MPDAGPSAPSAGSSSSSSLLSVLFYDDRYNETRDRGRQAIYRGLDRNRVPFVVGPPAEAFSSGAITASAGRPGDGPADRRVLRYRPGVKVDWIMQTLPSVTSEFVFLLDTDTVWLCSADEVVSKRVKLLKEASAREDAVLLFAEKGMWPPHQQFRGTVLRRNNTAGYPPDEAARPFRFLNAGAALGRPRDLLALHQCMRERYDGFPNACPAGHTPNGQLRYYMANNSWQPPRLDKPLHGGELKHHGMRLRGSNWGWEQGCFHMYYLEGLNGELPAHCPPIVLDRTGRFLIHLAGVQHTRLKWLPRQQRVTFTDTAEQPCALHANGPAKKALKPIWHWWEYVVRGHTATAPPRWR